VQDLWPESLEATGYIKNRMLLRLIGRLVGWIYKNVDLILAQSQAFIPEIARRANGVRILHYPNSVDSFFAKKPDMGIVIPEGLLWNDGFTVLFAGNIGQAQAVEVIVDAAKQLIHWPQIHFLVLGTGSRWEWMNEQIKLSKLNNVRMGGQLPGYMMPNFMQASDALLVTLADETIFNYTVPNKVQAYLASGRPVIACLNGEGARIIREAKAGMTAPACDADALVDCILQLFRMSEAERDKLGENGRNYFHKHYEHDNLLDELLFHLTSVVNK
jgi:glycosyltransferase involved in cell wall biosynthesis